MRIICGTILAAVVAVMCVAEAKEYTLADRRARETPDWYRTGVMYQIQPRAFTPEGTRDSPMTVATMAGRRTEQPLRHYNYRRKNDIIKMFS
jgi:hypothetical protein